MPRGAHQGKIAAVGDGIEPAKLVAAGPPGVWSQRASQAPGRAAEFEDLHCPARAVVDTHQGLRAAGELDGGHVIPHLVAGGPQGIDESRPEGCAKGCAPVRIIGCADIHGVKFAGGPVSADQQVVARQVQHCAKMGIVQAAEGVGGWNRGIDGARLPVRVI